MKAIVITQNNTPCSDAGAVRQHAMATILRNAGWDVTVLGYGKSNGGQLTTYEGVKYLSFRPDSDNRLRRLAGRILFGRRVMSYLQKSKYELKAVLVVDVLPSTFHALKRFSRKNHIQLIHDSVEWYSPEEYPEGEKNLEYRLKEYTNTKAVGQGWKVIAISRYLEEYFAGRCEKTVRIPVIIDVEESPYRIDIPRDSEKLRFVYAGSPGRKDYLSELLEGFSLLTTEQLQMLEIHLYGTNKQQLMDVCAVRQSVLDKLKDFLTAHGRVPREQAVQAVMDADFSMLLRDDTLRYAKAGFPTKIAECMSCGTIPFCNFSSDLELYLNDGENAVIIEGHTPQAVKAAAEKALEISAEDRIRMRKAARKTAEGNFDYRQYVDCMKMLVEDV